jgi:DNA-binding PadR family transcriptional regulator
MFYAYRMRDCTGRRGRFQRGPFVMNWEYSDRDGGRSRKRFDSNELQLVMLKLISEQPRHGYDLIREIEDRTGGAYAPSPGVIYPTLTLLDEMGLIEAQQSEGAKKLFAITELGKDHLAKHAEEVERLFARLAEMGETRARSERGSVRRAMGNLRQVLINRVMSGQLDDEALHQVVAMIDELAQKIERL